jgi:hypothetical protein
MTTRRPPFPAWREEVQHDEDTVKTREERLNVFLPARLLSSAVGRPDEVIPCILVNVSASGVQLLTDLRFSLFFPPFLGTQFTVEFFLGEIEVHDVLIEIVRSEKHNAHRLILGGRFVNLPTDARLSLRSTIASQSGAIRR